MEDVGRDGGCRGDGGCGQMIMKVPQQKTNDSRN